MTPADSLSLILRRLDEIERKLDRMMEELRPTAIGYSVRRGNRPRETDGLVRGIFLFRSVPTRHVPNDRETILLVQGRHVPSRLRSTNAPHPTRRVGNPLYSAREPSSVPLLCGF